MLAPQSIGRSCCLTAALRQQDIQRRYHRCELCSQLQWLVIFLLAQPPFGRMYTRCPNKFPVLLQFGVSLFHTLCTPRKVQMSGPDTWLQDMPNTQSFYFQTFVQLGNVSIEQKEHHFDVGTFLSHSCYRRSFYYRIVYQQRKSYTSLVHTCLMFDTCPFHNQHMFGRHLNCQLFRLSCQLHMFSKWRTPLHLIYHLLEIGQYHNYCMSDLTNDLAYCQTSLQHMFAMFDKKSV